MLAVVRTVVILGTNYVATKAACSVTLSVEA